jgi:adenosylcobyric acid synthase
VEQGGTLRGMGLLPVKTVFTEQKTRTRVSGTFGNVGGVLSALSRQPFEGYEIHMGESLGGAPLTSFTNELSGEAHPDGCQQGSVYGTYVHGILDQDAVAGAIVGALAERKGIDPARLGHVSGAEHKERQYDLLAQTLREHMDMAVIYRILKEGIA